MDTTIMSKQKEDEPHPASEPSTNDAMTHQPVTVEAVMAA